MAFHSNALHCNSNTYVSRLCWLPPRQFPRLFYIYIYIYIYIVTFAQCTLIDSGKLLFVLGVPLNNCRGCVGDCKETFVRTQLFNTASILLELVSMKELFCRSSFGIFFPLRPCFFFVFFFLNICFWGVD